MNGGNSSQVAMFCCWAGFLFFSSLPGFIFFNVEVHVKSCYQAANPCPAGKKKNLAPLKSTWPTPVAKQTYYNQEMGHVEKGETTAGRAKERRNGIGNKK